LISKNNVSFSINFTVNRLKPVSKRKVKTPADIKLPVIWLKRLPESIAIKALKTGIHESEIADIEDRIPSPPLSPVVEITQDCFDDLDENFEEFEKLSVNSDNNEVCGSTCSSNRKRRKASYKVLNTNPDKDIDKLFSSTGESESSDEDSHKDADFVPEELLTVDQNATFETNINNNKDGDLADEFEFGSSKRGVGNRMGKKVNFRFRFVLNFLQCDYSNRTFFGVFRRNQARRMNVLLKALWPNVSPSIYGTLLFRMNSR